MTVKYRVISVFRTTSPHKPSMLFAMVNSYEERETNEMSVLPFCG